MTLGGVALVIAVLGLVGAILRLPILTSWLDGSVDMKAPTAVALVFCAASLILCALSRNASHFLSTGVSMLGVAACAVIASMLLRYISYPASTVGAHAIADPSMPSLMTIIAVTVYSAAMVYRSIATSLEIKCTFSRVCGWLLVLVAGTAMFGHYWNLPGLYYYARDTSTGMAIPTAAALMALGLGLLILPSTRRSSHPSQ